MEVSDSHTPEVRDLGSERLDGKDHDEAMELVEKIQQNRPPSILTPEEVPGVLLPYQGAWHLDTSSVRIAEKGRRIGFSWGALAAESVIEGGCQASAGGMDQFYMGYNQAMAAEFIGDCTFIARALNTSLAEVGVFMDSVLIDDERRDILRYSLQLTSGFRIEALSSNPYNWRGKQGHARIDEAAFHKDIREVVKGALAFRMWAGRIDIVSTHNTEENQFNQWIKDVQAEKLGWSHHRHTFKDALLQGFYKRVCLKLGKEYSEEAEAKYEAEIRADYPDAEDAAEELDCTPKRGSGPYFSDMLIESCQKKGIPILRYTQKAEFVLDPNEEAITEAWLEENLRPIINGLDPRTRKSMGQDFARSGDLSAILLSEEVRERFWETIALIELRNIPFESQRLIVKWIFENVKGLSSAKFDARGNGQSHAEAAYKLRPEIVECVMFTRPWYAEHFPKLKSAFEQQRFLLPDDPDILLDARLVVQKNGDPGLSAGRLKGSDGKDRHGDTMVAAVLAWAGSELPPPEYAYESASIPGRRPHEPGRMAMTPDPYEDERGDDRWPQGGY
ncbi:MAG: hypothetical protein ACPGOV_11825 [Magnetovibrionaceae bacterium]